MNEDKEIVNKEDKAPKRSIAKRIIKWLLIAVSGFFFLLIAAVSVAVWILTPEKLTPLVEKYSSEYLLADVEIKKVELTFWSTFPHLTLDVDSLRIKNNNVAAEYSDLASVDKLHGTVNLLALLKYSVELNDLYIGHPRADLVVFENGTTNFDIIPESADSVAEKKSDIPPPSICFNRFLIEDAGPIRFRSLRDSTDFSLNIRNLDIGGESQPTYLLGVGGDGSMATPAMKLDNLVIGLNGKVGFDLRKPDRVALDDFVVRADSLTAEFTTHIQLRDTMTIEKLDFSLPDWDVARIMTLLPDNLKNRLKDINTDLRFSIKGNLTEAYPLVFPKDSTECLAIPDMNLSLSIPKSTASWKRLRLTDLELDADAVTSSKGIDATKINIDKLIVSAKNVGFGIKGTVTTPVSNPRFNGIFKGGINFSNLPKEIYSSFASQMNGTLDADVSLRASLADIKPKNFYRLFMDGEVSLHDFSFLSKDSLTSLYAGESLLKFGSNISKKTKTGATVDSLLNVSVKGDTLSLRSGTSAIALSQYTVGAGTKVMKQITDSTIVPLGALIEFSRLRLSDSADSVLLAMRDTKCNALIMSHPDNNRKPVVRLNFDNRFLFGGNPQGRIALLGSHIDVNATYRTRPLVSDSLRAVYRARRAEMMKNNAGPTDEELNQIDISVDSGFRAILNKWSISGSIKATRGQGFARAFPANNKIRNVDVHFNTDSVILKDFMYEVGSSDFKVNGEISNIRRAITRKRNNILKINFDIVSDTIDVNYLSALAMSSGSESAMPENEDDAEKMLAGTVTNTVVADTAQMKPILIPANIDGKLHIRANNLLYTDFNFNDFRGDVTIRNSAVQLWDLAANSSIGRLSLAALYSAPSPEEIEFGMGLNVKNFHIERMIKLIPAIDSLMPMIKDFSGIINADLAATGKVDPRMNVDIPSLEAALKLSGDSLVLLDADTFKSLSKWLFFKNKKHNMIDKMEVEMVINDGVLEIFPFIFDIDRYRLGVMGSNDLAMNLNYHISVLKSPMPFKFGINIKGNVDNMKIRLGGAKFKNNSVIERVSIADTTRINLVNQIQNIFRRSARSGLRLNKPKTSMKITEEPGDTLSSSEIIQLEQQK